MNLQRYTLATVAVFVFIFAYDFVVHGYLLNGLYMETAAVWRPQGESIMWVMNISQILSAAFFTLLFTRHYEGKGLREGLRFGMYVGALLAALQLGCYMYLPVPFSIVGYWMLSAFVMSLGIGAVLSFTYRA